LVDTYSLQLQGEIEAAALFLAEECCAALDPHAVTTNSLNSCGVSRIGCPFSARCRRPAGLPAAAAPYHV